MSFLSFHAAAAARGDGLRRELLALLAGDPAASRPELALRHEGTIRSRPDPKSTDVAGTHTNVSRFPQASARQATTVARRKTGAI
jgi:hypothetical protein